MGGRKIKRDEEKEHVNGECVKMRQFTDDGYEEQKHENVTQPQSSTKTATHLVFRLL